MSSDTPPSVSVVVNGTSMEPEGWRATVEMLESASAGADVDVSLALIADHADDAQDTLAWLEDRGVALSYLPPTCVKEAALNTAAAAAGSDLLIILEQDVELSPGALPRLVDHWHGSMSDWMWLPSSASIDPAFYADSAILMIRRDHFLRIRGYDERPQLAEVASPDLRIRLNRAGLAGEPLSFGVAVFPRSSGAALSEAEVQKRIAQDRSIYRNLSGWSVPRSRRPILVSVAIATRDRAEYLADSIRSVLNQTMEDFEIVIVDDGSTDNTREVVESFTDPRISYHHQAANGISTARNLAADVSRGHFTAVHDDDDIMVPDRLEVSLKALTEDVDASYGSWVNFDNETGDMVLHVIRDGFDADLVAFNGQGPGHSTWLVPTALVRQTRYDETYTASVDHNLATRLAWAGCRWIHSERVAYLRRMHPTQVSATDGGNQKIGHVLTRFGNEFAASGDGRSAMREAGGRHQNPVVPGREDPRASFGAWLPDHLVSRTAVFRGNVSNKVMKLARYESVDVVLTDRDLDSGRLLAEIGVISGVTWEDMVRLRAEGEMTYTLTAHPSGADAAHDIGAMNAPEAARRHIDSLVRGNGGAARLWVAALDGLSPADQNLLSPAQRRSRIVAASNGERVVVDLFSFTVPLSSPQVASALRDLVTDGKVLLIHGDERGRALAERTSSEFGRL